MSVRHTVITGLIYDEAPRTSLVLSPRHSSMSSRLEGKLMLMGLNAEELSQLSEPDHPTKIQEGIQTWIFMRPTSGMRRGP